MTRTIYITLILTLLISFNNRAFPQKEESSVPTSTVVELPSRKMTVKQALDELFKIPGLSIVYGGSEKIANNTIAFPSRSLPVERIMNEIELQSPVDFILNNGHIIVKNRKLEESYTITGKLKDNITKEGLISANILIEGTSTGFVTDNEGSFLINLKPGNYSLIFRYIGYEEKIIEVKLYKNLNLNVELKVKQHQINSVNIQGSYNSIEPLEKGRDIKTIDSKVIGRLNTNNVNDALQGRVEGVWTTKSSGAPGDHHKIRIRGISSIFGSSDPLYIVDGAIIPIVNFENIGISDLNSHDIEKITVLKDASSTALYGNMGSNGVIIIETKKGGATPQFSFSVKQGFQDFSKRYSFMDSEKFLNTLELSDNLINTSFYKIFPTAKRYEKYPLYRDSLGNTLSSKDYQDELFKTGYISEYQLSGSGNYKTVDYYISGNYYNHNGIIHNTNYKKYTLTANLSKTFAEKLALRFLYKGSYQVNKNTIDNYLGNNVILKGINYEPAYESTPDSFLYKTDRLFFNDIYSNNSIKNLSRHSLPFDTLIYANDKTKADAGNTINLQLFYKINNEFSFRAISSVSFRNYTFSTLNTPYAFGGMATKEYLKSTEKYTYFNHQYELNYSKQFKNHNLSALLRYRGYRDNINWKVDSISNVSYDGIEPEDDIFLRGSQVIYGERGSVIRNINSGIINLNYNYKRKFFLSLISNYENIKEGNYVSSGQLFNSIAFNWDLVRESILPFPKWINEFNLFVNWGQSGNYPLNSLSNDLFSTTDKYASGDSLMRAIYISNLANHHLMPEKVEEINLGLKISLFDERLRFSADYYKKNNTNLLVKRTIPIYYGGGYIFQNIGEMKNEGLELSLEAIPVKLDNFYWDTRLGLSTNSQMITKLYENESISFNNTDVLIPDFIAKENEPLGAIIGYNYQGRIKNMDPSEYTGANSRCVKNLGLAYLRGDTLNPKRNSIAEGDKMVIGNSIPDFTFNWLNNIEYKNFYCEMLWYGAIGVDKYNATKASTYITGLNSDVRDIVMDTLKFHTTNIFYESSYFVEDASFIRLKTLSFTYSQPKKIASKIKMEYTLSFENLITITKYSGYDPEASIYTDNNFTDNAIDKGAYPNPRGVFFSVNMTF